MDQNSIVDRYRNASVLREAAPHSEVDTPAPRPFDVAMDNLAPMRAELERRWAARNQRRDPSYVPPGTTNGRWVNRLRADAVMSRYIRRFMGIQNPDADNRPDV